VLIDVHAHFYTERCGRADWERVNARRLEAGACLGVDVHVASILGTYGRRSPTYFPSPEDVSHANDAMRALARTHPGTVRGYCLVNPNFTDHALAELALAVSDGMIGIKLAASRRATDPLLDPIAVFAAAHDLPILQHVWQHRRRDWPGQEASDAAELAVLAERHPRARFILAHLGGGGDWSHTLGVVRSVPNVWVDLSGSGCDTDMLERAVVELGANRLLWGCDLTMAIGIGKLRYLESLGLDPDALEAIRWRNAAGIFPRGGFDAG
jgi:predicted TIM-barrel fold metal-dependent hydrolase